MALEPIFRSSKTNDRALTLFISNKSVNFSPKSLTNYVCLS